MRLQTILHTFVPGLPQAQGSMRAMPHAKSGKVIMLHSNALLPAWRRTIQTHVQAIAWKWRSIPMTTQPVSVGMTFQFNDHPRQKKALPDLDKLVRAVFDSLTGIAFTDDKMVVTLSAAKILDNALPEGLVLQIHEILCEHDDLKTLIPTYDGAEPEEE